jgi:hypothetical protein
MKPMIGHLRIGLTLFLASLVPHGLAQSTPLQVAGSGWQALTTTSPSVAIAQAMTGPVTEYVAWKGASTNKIYFSSFNGTEWAKQQVVGGSGWTAETDAAPALAYDINFTNEIWLAWKGASTNEIYFSSFNGTEWATQQVLGGTGWTAETSTAPAFGGTSTGVEDMLLAWKGKSPNQKIWYTYGGRSGWAVQQTLGGSGWVAMTSIAPGVLAPVAPAVVWKGASTNDVWISFGNNGTNPVTWFTQQRVLCNNPSWIAETNASPAAAWLIEEGPSTNAVFWKGQSGSSIWYSYQDGTGCGWAQQATVQGSGWSAKTNVAPAIGNDPGNAAILAWTDADDNTIWVLDPTTLPGLSSYLAGEDR